MSVRVLDVKCNARWHAEPIKNLKLLWYDNILTLMTPHNSLFIQISRPKFQVTHICICIYSQVMGWLCRRELLLPVIDWVEGSWPQWETTRLKRRTAQHQVMHRQCFRYIHSAMAGRHTQKHPCHSYSFQLIQSSVFFVFVFFNTGYNHML